MKKFLVLFFFALSFFIGVPPVSASTFGTNFSCDKVAAEGDLIACRFIVSGTGSKANIEKVEGNFIYNSSSFVLDHIEQGSSISLAENKGNSLSLQVSEDYTYPAILFTAYFKTLFQSYDNTISFQYQFTSDVDNSKRSHTETIVHDQMHESKLSSLTINDGAIPLSFDPNVLEYQVTTQAESIVLTGSLKDSNATCNIDLNHYEVALDYGANEIEIVVTAMDQSTRTYRLIVTREDHRNDDSQLKSLTINNQAVSLQSTLYSYTYEVPYEVTSADVVASALPTSTVEVDGNTSLAVGNNTFVIRVTSEKGSVSKYVLTVRRQEQVLSSDSSIRRLTIQGYDLDFDSDETNYEISVPFYVSKLDFDLDLNDEKATYKIVDNEDLKNGSVVNVEVEAEDGSTTTYSFQIQKSFLPLILLVGIGIAAFIVILVVCLKIRKKKREIV
mgnify:FL=1